MGAFRLTGAKWQDLSFGRLVDLPISPMDTFILVREAWRSSAKLSDFLLYVAMLYFC